MLKEPSKTHFGYFIIVAFVWMIYRNGKPCQWPYNHHLLRYFLSNRDYWKLQMFRNLVQYLDLAHLPLCIVLHQTISSKHHFLGYGIKVGMDLENRYLFILAGKVRYWLEFFRLHSSSYLLEDYLSSILLLIYSPSLIQ